ncbi:MAG: methylenetetrahydromethanopterin dehydrogenase [Candidatus Bathyarchaeota archaeon]
MKELLFMFDTSRRASPFDLTMAYDAGFDAVIPYENVTPRDATSLTQDAMFSRSPKAFKHTCFFINGRDVKKAEETLKAVKQAMFPPFETNVIIDPSGAYTTAVALVAKVEDAMNSHGLGGLTGKKYAVFGTGPVGITVAEILTSLDCVVTVAEPNPMLNSDYLLQHEAFRGVLERHGAYLHGVSAPTQAEKLKILKQADVIFTVAARGVRIIEKEIIDKLKPTKVLIDTNAVPPLGIEGLELNDYMKELAPKIYGIGALIIGDLKYKLQKQLLKEAYETQTKKVYDYKYALFKARDLLREIAAPKLIQKQR